MQQDTQELPQEIIVTFTPNEHEADLADKYLGLCGKCFLEEALYKAGYRNVSVVNSGNTRIGEALYESKYKFDFVEVLRAFTNKESMTVTLIRYV